MKNASPTGDADADRALGNIRANVIATRAGMVMGGSTGAATASNADMYNRSLGCTNGKCEGSAPGSVSKELRNGVVSLAEMAVNLPNGGPFATPGDPGYISLDGMRVQYAAGDQVGPRVEFFAAVLAPACCAKPGVLRTKTSRRVIEARSDKTPTRIFDQG